MEPESIQAADVVKTGSGRQYHIGIAPGEVAPYILLCGDPARAKKVSKLFDSVEHKLSNREYLTFTGSYQNMPISVMATGIGCDNTEIAFIELTQCVSNATFIRIGSCGSLQPEIQLEDLVISTGAVRLENTSTYFVPDGYPAVANSEVVMFIKEACQALNMKWHQGITATASGFYGAQGRHVPGFPPRHPDLFDELANIGIVNFEMETSTLLTLASLAKVRAGTVCAVFANRPQNSFVAPDNKSNAEMNCIKTGLTAMKMLYQLDQIRAKRSDPNWLPLASLLERETQL